MKEKILLIWKHLKQGTLKKMWKQTLWIYQYGRRYWKAMILYTLLGLVGTGVSLVSSLISKDLVDIITGHQTGKLVSTFAAMIGFSVANILVSQASGYASTFINLKVDSEIKNDIFAKMLVTDWESLTDYHTGDLVTRWSSDASNISSGILNWIPNLIIYTFRFISAQADWSGINGTITLNITFNDTIDQVETDDASVQESWSGKTATLTFASTATNPLTIGVHIDHGASIDDLQMTGFTYSVN